MIIPVLYAIFLLSGAAGLMYESIWTRYLGLFVGHSAYAQVIVLGMTFPLMSAGVVRRVPERSGRALSMLYFTNSGGAALGVLIAGFWLVDRFGLPGTLRAAALVNLVVSLAVMALIQVEKARGRE